MAKRDTRKKSTVNASCLDGQAFFLKYFLKFCMAILFSLKKKLSCVCNKLQECVVFKEVRSQARVLFPQERSTIPWLFSRCLSHWYLKLTHQDKSASKPWCYKRNKNFGDTQKRSWARNSFLQKGCTITQT